MRVFAPPNDQEYLVDFKHYLYNKPLLYKTKHKGLRELRASTTCEIWHCRPVGNMKIEGKVIVNFGWSYCAVEDRFNKEHGRRLALRRAVEPLPRKLRGLILHEYFNRHRNGHTQNGHNRTQGGFDGTAA